MTPSSSSVVVHRWDTTWRSFTSVQGGSVVGVALRSAADLATEQGLPGRTVQVRTVAAHLLAAVVPDVDVEVSSVPERVGATSSIRTEVRQTGVLCVVAQVLVSSVPEGAPAHGPVPVPELPAGHVTPAEAEELALPVDFVPVSQHVEMRVVGAGRPLAGGTEPRLTIWSRVRDSAGVADPLLALGLLADALPPSLYAVRTEPVALPTVELTMHLTSPPPAVGAWVRVDQVVAWSDGWSCVDEAQLHDDSGLLVATARQSRRLPRP